MRIFDYFLAAQYTKVNCWIYGKNAVERDNNCQKACQNVYGVNNGRCEGITNMCLCW